MNGRRGEDIWEKAETDTDQYLEYMKMNKKMVGNPTEKRAKVTNRQVTDRRA